MIPVNGHSLVHVLQAIKFLSRRVWIRFQSDRGAAHLAAIKRRMLNPLAKRLVMPQRPPNTQAKVTVFVFTKPGVIPRLRP